MRSGWFANRLTAALATVFGLSLMLAANLSAAQQRHINQVNPDLDSDDQLAPCKCATAARSGVAAGERRTCIGTGGATRGSHARHGSQHPHARLHWHVRQGFKSS